jgi:hypothetical protein
MIKKILLLAFATTIMASAPLVINATPAIEIIENDFQDVTITVYESTLHVTGANGQTLQIYNVAGVCVMSFKIEGADKKYDLNVPKGCYIVKVGKTVRKISIR